MDDSRRFCGPQFRADEPEEYEAVCTTIVGGRPPGSGQPVGAIPRGIELLIKKAAIDADFRKYLLEHRAKAANEIGLTLDPAEALMLAAVPQVQLEAIINRTTVPQEHRRVFLGKAAAAMLAAMGLSTAGCNQGSPSPAGDRPDDPPEIPNEDAVTRGIRPDEPPERLEPTDGIRPDMPPESQ